MHSFLYFYPEAGQLALTSCAQWQALLAWGLWAGETPMTASNWLEARIIGHAAVRFVRDHWTEAVW